MITAEGENDFMDRKMDQLGQPKFLVYSFLRKLYDARDHVAIVDGQQAAKIAQRTTISDYKMLPT